MINSTPRISWVTLKKAALLKRFGIYNTPSFIPVFFQARSGSTVLGETLSTHTHCLSLNEAFINYRGKELPFTYRYFLQPPTEQYLYRHALKGKYLTHTFLEFNEWYYPIFNKTREDQDEVFTFIGQHFPGMVFLYRRNQLKRIVSFLRAKENEIWHNKAHETDRPAGRKFYLELHQSFGSPEMPSISLLNYLDNISAAINNKLAIARKRIPNLLELVYEDDIEQDVMVGVNKVLERFQVPASYKPLNVPLVKTSRGLEHDLENYEEVKAYLQGSPYAWMLDD